MKKQYEEADMKCTQKEADVKRTHREEMSEFIKRKAV